MPWGRLDDGLYDHPKLDKLGRSKLPAIGLWTLSISWSNRRLTDGFVPSSQVTRLGGSKALAQILVDAELFDEVAGGYQIHDFLTFNDSAEAVQQRRDQAAERQRRHRGVTPLVTRDSERDATRDKSVSHATPAGARARQGAGVPSRPNPVLETPQPPASGGPSRANGTSRRQVAAAAQAEQDESSRMKAWRRNQRNLAYARGAISEAQQIEMNGRDAPLEELPDWIERLTKLRDVDEPDPLPAFLGGHER